MDWSEAEAPRIGEGEEISFGVETALDSIFFKVRVEVHDSITSELTTIEYPIHVYVPEGYGESTQTYPVIYATDGQWISEGFSSAIAEKEKQVILVTVEQGPGDRRATDYLLPGATTYFEFFTEELMPAIETVYRVDASERTICGTSYGGLLVGLVLLMDDAEAPHFTNYLSFDGSFWTHRTATNALEQTRFEAGNEMDVTLYLTSATGTQNNDTWVTNFKNKIESRGYSGLTVIRKSYPVEHNDVAQPSFEEALDELF
ncbi:Putative esterase superfamily [Verrucomicrobiia bacterium DG1235]|nr:Putative esterase superfamily [Verrucomicrobiae bacterium DG1235]